VKENIKKLYRSTENGMLTGVCAGLGEYFNFDPTLIRLIFVLLTLGGGGGVFIYIILSLVIPKKPGGEFKIDKERITELTKDIGDKTKKLAHGKNHGNFLGIILVMIGAVALWNQITPGFGWHWFWPMVLIIAGMYLLFKEK
jgi:phage shock protein C